MYVWSIKVSTMIVVLRGFLDALERIIKRVLMDAVGI